MLCAVYILTRCLPEVFVFQHSTAAAEYTELCLPDFESVVASSLKVNDICESDWHKSVIEN